ncbi:mannitol operon activator, BglG family protein, partial [Streptococcus pneumoniae MNZ37]
VLSLFIIGHMGLFFYTKIGSIISIGDLPTTNIIEPLFLDIELILNENQRANYNILKLE